MDITEYLGMSIIIQVQLRNLNLMFLGPCIIVIDEGKKPTRYQLLFLFYFLETQHVSGINMPIFRSMRLCCWTTTLTVSWFAVCWEFGCGLAGVVSGLPAEALVGFFYSSTIRNLSSSHWFYFCKKLNIIKPDKRIIFVLQFERRRTKSVKYNKRINSNKILI